MVEVPRNNQLFSSRCYLIVVSQSKSYSHGRELTHALRLYLYLHPHQLNRATAEALRLTELTQSRRAPRPVVNAPTTLPPGQKQTYSIKPIRDALCQSLSSFTCPSSVVYF